jgi:Big-like domain-containing protein
VPDIVLGQSHDFRTTALAETPTLADNTVDNSKSGFSLDPVSSESATASQSGEVTLENPSFNGEVINATQPAIIGTGPKGTVLSITINSENEYTGSATIDEDGEWEFTPPAGLEPGAHTVTVSYIDSEGLEQSITRNFVIAAAGESETPAITATPSGESSGATDSSRTKQPSTESGVPEPGTFEVTMMMLLTGLGLLVGGIIVKNKI